MANGFLELKRCRDLNVIQVANLSEQDAHELLVNARWGGIKNAVCPKCAVIGKHNFIRRRYLFRCRACFSQFSVTADTVLARRRLSFKTIAVALYMFAVAPKGRSAGTVHNEVDRLRFGL